MSTLALSDVEKITEAKQIAIRVRSGEVEHSYCVFVQQAV